MAAASSSINDAFERAKREFKDDLRDEQLYRDILQTTSISQVYDATDKLQQEQAKNGHLRHLAKIEPYLARLNEYSKAVEVFVQVKPDVMALIWGPIVLLLQWASALKKSFDAIVNTTEEIGLALPEFNQAGQLFGDKTQIQDVLLLFFRDILDFYRLAFRFFRLPRLQFVFESLWPKHRDKLKAVASIIERHKLMLRDRVLSEHILQEHEARRRDLEYYEERESETRRKEYNAIMTKLSPQIETHHKKLNLVRSHLCEGSGDWLLKDATFTTWLDAADKSSRLLWLQGIPGAGKTVLSSVVVDKTRTLGRVVFAYLNYTASDTSALSIVHSLIFQLIGDDADLQTVLCESTQQNIGDSLVGALKVWSTLLLTCTVPVYVIVDGLDEIKESHRWHFTKNILESLQDHEDLLVCLSSRPESDLQTLLESKAASIRVNERNSDSIERFVRHWTENWFARSDFYPDTKDQVEKWLVPLASKAKGMFLYAEVVLESIKYLDNIKEISAELACLPESLDAAYARIFQRVNALHPTQRHRARTLLGWVACSPKAMKVQEVQHALYVTLDDRQGTYQPARKMNARELCGPIIEVVDDYVQFVHFTVKEYILSPNIEGFISLHDSTLSLIMKCLAYLCQQHHDNQLSREIISEGVLSGTYILHDFATSNWLKLLEQYVQRIPEPALPDGLTSLLKRFTSERINHRYRGDDHGIGMLNSGQLKKCLPELYTVLSQAANFRHLCSSSEYLMKEGATWIEGDPLTLSRTSVTIQATVDSLLKCVAETEDHTQRCPCSFIRRHYGERPFKCRFTFCPFRYQGFETQNKRRSHEHHHDRPWSCSVPMCEFASGGFLSRKMRDEHLDQYHQAKDQTQDATDVSSDNAELELMWADLIKASNREAAVTLCNTFGRLSYEAQHSLVGLAAAVGTSAFLTTILSNEFNWGTENHWAMVSSAARSGNTQNFKLIMDFLVERTENFYSEDRISPRVFSSTACSYSFAEVLRSDSADLYEIFEKYAQVDFETIPLGGGLSKSNLALEYTRPRSLKATIGDLYRQRLVLQFWKSINLTGNLEIRHLGDTLVNVASSCRSVLLAEHLIQSGADVNHRRSGNHMTPLHHAARGTSAHAADLMRFLLLHGADPDRNSTTSKNRIRDEEGAKGIYKWLRMSWDELVNQCQNARMESGNT